MTVRFMLSIGRGVAISIAQFSSETAMPSARDGSSDWTVQTNDHDALLVLAGDAGVVIGRPFHRHGGSPVSSFEAAEVAAIRDTAGGHLLDRYWGSYVAMVRTDHGHIVIRDPSGTLPCLWLTSAGAVVLASDPEVFASAGLAIPPFNDNVLARGLYLPALPNQGTGFEGIQDLLPGQALRIQKDGLKVENAWSPWDYVVHDPEGTSHEHAVRLLRSILSCTTAWGKAHGRGLVSVSGGLDSSIVAASLHRSGNGLECLTLATDDPIGDERPYSKLLTDHLGLALLEAPHAIEDIDFARPTVPWRARPMGRLDGHAYDAAVVRSARAAGCNAVFTGNGGDNAFYLSHSARPVADRWLVEGLGKGLWRTVQDVRQLTGAHLLEVMRHAIGAVRLADRTYSWSPDPSFMTRAVLETQMRQAIDHPWLTVPEEGALPGKAGHIAMLMRMQHSIEAYDQRGGLPFIHPLVSQPVIEQCLAIPTWHQCAGGQDRSVARQAFAQILPPSVINRRGKGSPDGFAYQVLRQFRAEIRERLIDGYLAKAHILDPVAIEHALTTEQGLGSGAALRLLHLVDAENWIAHWTARRASL